MSRWEMAVSFDVMTVQFSFGALVWLAPFREINQGIIDTQRPPWITQPLDVCLDPIGPSAVLCCEDPKNYGPLPASSLVDGLFFLFHFSFVFVPDFHRVVPAPSLTTLVYSFFPLLIHPLNREKNSVGIRAEKELLNLIEERKTIWLMFLAPFSSSQWTSRKENKQ